MQLQPWVQRAGKYWVSGTCILHWRTRMGAGKLELASIFGMRSQLQHPLHVHSDSSFRAPRFKTV